jgi:hypothetical protein
LTVAGVRHGLCAFFGGAYDADSRSYRSPQIAGLGAVRRAFAKRFDQRDYTLDEIADTGCLMVVQLERGDERRIAVGGATSGVKRRHHEAHFHCFVRSAAGFAEDAQDFADALLDGVIARIHSDRTCGSGGIEVGGFQVGEGDAPMFEWEMPPAETASEVTKVYLHIVTDVLEYVAA